jgi:Flp pilus assembly protein TadD
MAMPFLSPEEFDERAHRLYDAGEYDEALALLRDGLTHHPDAADLHVGIGHVRLAREEYAWARLAFEQALAFEPEHEDAWIGLGEVLLKLGRPEEALGCFARIDGFGLDDDEELGLAISRALYREGFYHESRRRLRALAEANPDSAEVAAAQAYTLHALGDDVGARRELRRALGLDAGLHEARIYLAHLLFEQGARAAALREMERVPPSEHWDVLSLWRLIELKCALDGLDERDAALAPWRGRLAELDTEPDEIDHLLALVEAQFEGAEAPAVHRVRTADGALFTGTWEQIVFRLRDTLADPAEPISLFMSRPSERVTALTGSELPCHHAEAFVRESARLGLLQIES